VHNAAVVINSNMAAFSHSAPAWKAGVTLIDDAVQNDASSCGFTREFKTALFAGAKIAGGKDWEILPPSVEE